MASVLTEAAAEQVNVQISIPGFPRDISDGDLPPAFAPLVRNAWYVIAKRDDVGRELRHITALGEPLVMYRTEAGEAVVLDDRCAHRRFRLSKSKLVGDAIQCGYHGFKYDQSGACIWAPTLKVKPKFGVRRYPSAERGPWLWAWFGEPSGADPANIPFPELDPDQTWTSIDGYKLNPGNYMLLIENFLDLTHLHFLHGPEFGSMAQVENPTHRLNVGPEAVGWRKVTDDSPSGLLAAMAGRNPKQLVTVVEVAQQFGPSIHHASNVRLSKPGEEYGLYPFTFFIVHAITPQDITNTHQFFQVSLTFTPAGGMEDFRDALVNVVFQQDVDVIAEANELILTDTRSGNVESGIPGDRYGIKMRQILRRMKEREAL